MAPFLFKTKVVFCESGQKITDGCWHSSTGISPPRGSHAALLVACDASNARTTTTRAYHCPACASSPAGCHTCFSPVKSLRLSRWGKASWRTCRPARHRQNVSVCPMTRRHCPAGVFVKEQRGRRETGRRGKGKPPVYGRGLNRQSPMGLTMEWISLICNRRFIYSSMQI